MATIFRFDASTHAYFLDGQQVPSITQMIEKAGLVDSDHYTEHARRRGTEVHDLTASHDLHALNPDDYQGPWRGYLQAHVAAMAVVRPRWSHIEEPFVHGRLRFGGRPDRVGVVYALRSIVELKSGAPEPCHAIQMALQAILVAEESGTPLPPEHWDRYALYLKPSGKFKLVQHQNRADFDEAARVIRQCA